MTDAEEEPLNPAFVSKPEVNEELKVNLRKSTYNKNQDKGFKKGVTQNDVGIAVGTFLEINKIIKEIN